MHLSREDETMRPGDLISFYLTCGEGATRCVLAGIARPSGCGWALALAPQSSAGPGLIALGPCALLDHLQARPPALPASSPAE